MSCWKFLKWNKRTRQREEELDNDKFLEAYAQKAIKGWKGLKVKHLPVLMPVDISEMNGNDDIVYSEEEALDLLKNSAIFDQFVTDSMNDFEQFSKKKKESLFKLISNRYIKSGISALEIELK